MPDPVSAQIRNARLAAGLSQAELADRMNVDPSVVSKLESGKAALSKGMFTSLVMALHSTIRPVDLIRAMGWTVPLGAEANLPPDLADAIVHMNPEGLRLLSVVANSLKQTYPR